MGQSVFLHRAYNVCWFPYKRSTDSKKGARDVCLVSIWLDSVSFDIRRKTTTHARLRIITLRAFVYVRFCLLQSKQTEKCFSDWFVRAFTVNLRVKTNKRTKLRYMCRQSSAAHSTFSSCIHRPEFIFILTAVGARKFGEKCTSSNPMTNPNIRGWGKISFRMLKNKMHTRNAP